jgi:hypothetical protein
MNIKTSHIPTYLEGKNIEEVNKASAEGHCRSWPDVLPLKTALLQPKDKVCAHMDAYSLQACEEGAAFMGAGASSRTYDLALPVPRRIGI